MPSAMKEDTGRGSQYFRFSATLGEGRASEAPPSAFALEQMFSQVVYIT